MAAPATPISTQLGRGFYQLCIDAITLCSNLSIPISTDQAQTGVLSGTTATLAIAALTAQRNLL